MELARALDQISAIHDHLAKGEVWKGYRPLPVAVSGLLALAAAGAAQLVPEIAPPGAGSEAAVFVIYWSVVALLSLALSGVGIAARYLRDDPFGRERTRRVVGQFAPALAGGAGASVAILWADPGRALLLPGLWALLFGLGVFASRPYLPRATGWVALYYLTAGIALLAAGGELSPWQVGGIFGPGQLGMAAVLWWNLERRELPFPGVEPPTGPGEGDTPTEDDG